ncbi:carboxymuconolactone decarboxylase family protein [Tissierella pigra]|uniref:carboxymuconolactone decarboxylase family protein n=1 Tax=Tissierella pigra TaxID=2607614 RepID=UPI001C0F8AC7|nr:carboxymuconolactone decarboxylase family protein [Tissierella pigra]MBU5425464.1 carboxymuconolactone decarboxylase family protein [Tissierella pigra]
MKSPREYLADFNNGMASIAATNPEQLSAFGNFADTVFKDGAIDLKKKELVAIGISVYSRCEYCIAIHAYNALKAGLTKEEIMEAAMVAIAFGGGPSLGYAITLLKDSLEEFAKDFE